MDQRARGRRNLIIIATLFLAPVLIAFSLYYGKLWRPAGSASMGELIDPARPLVVAGLRNADGTRGERGRAAGQMVSHIYR